MYYIYYFHVFKKFGQTRRRLMKGEREGENAETFFMIGLLPASENLKQTNGITSSTDRSRRRYIFHQESEF